MYSLKGGADLHPESTLCGNWTFPRNPNRVLSSSCCVIPPFGGEDGVSGFHLHLSPFLILSICLASFISSLIVHVSSFFFYVSWIIYNVYHRHNLLVFQLSFDSASGVLVTSKILPSLNL